MNQAEAIDKISKALTNLTSQTIQENLAGLDSKNRLLEDLFLPVFAIVFNAHSLRNLNILGQNQPALDLGDDKNRIGIQVTAEHESTKVTKTLEGVTNGKLYDKYDRIVIFMAQIDRPKFKKKTKDEWAALCKGKFAFNPQTDILALPQLLSLIKSLPYKEIEEIQKTISKSIVGEEYVNVLSAVLNLTKHHLSYEQRTARYIPGVFTENREIKQLCRCFCHPVLFFRRTVELAEQLNLGSWNSFLDKAGVAPLPVPEFASLSCEQTLLGVQSASSKTCGSFEGVRSALKNYKDFARRSPTPETIPPSKRPFYEQNRHVLVNEIQGIRYSLDDIEKELGLAAKRIFLLTGHAGQGKTNLLCDLVENFLIKHNIPCAFLSAREFALFHMEDKLVLSQQACEEWWKSIRERRISFVALWKNVRSFRKTIQWSTSSRSLLVPVLTVFLSK